MKLTSDALNVGMLVTVYDNKPRVQVKMDVPSPEGGVLTLTQQTPSNDGKGDIMVISCIELPYVVVRVYDRCGEPWPSVYDTRATTFQFISMEFARCALRKEEFSTLEREMESLLKKTQMENSTLDGLDDEKAPNSP